MSIFDTGITDTITRAIESTSKAYSSAIVEGFDRAAIIIADRLEKIETNRSQKMCKCEDCKCCKCCKCND